MKIRDDGDECDYWMHGLETIRCRCDTPVAENSDSDTW